MKSREKKIVSLLRIISEIEKNNIMIQIGYHKNGLTKEIICPAIDLERFIVRAWFFPENDKIFSIESLTENINDIYHDSLLNLLVIQVFGGQITVQPCITNFKCPFCGNRPFNTEIERTKKRKSLYEFWLKNKINNCKHEITITCESFTRFGNPNIKEFYLIFAKNFNNILNEGYDKKLIQRQIFQIPNNHINNENISLKYYTSEKPMITLIELIGLLGNEIVLTNKELQLLLLSKYFPKLKEDHEFLVDHLNITFRTLEEYLVSYKNKINSIKLLTEEININPVSKVMICNKLDNR